MMALVVAIAGMMLPAMAAKKKKKKTDLQQSSGYNRCTGAVRGQLTLDVKEALHAHAEDVHAQVGGCGNKVHSWGVILKRDFTTTIKTTRLEQGGRMQSLKAGSKTGFLSYRFTWGSKQVLPGRVENPAWIRRWRTGFLQRHMELDPQTLLRFTAAAAPGVNYLIPDQLGAVSLPLQLRMQRLHAAPEEPTLAPDPQNLLVLQSCAQRSLLRRSWDTQDERGSERPQTGVEDDSSDTLTTFF